MNDEPPPRLARGMGARFALAAVVVVLLAGAVTATAVLLEVSDIGQAIGAGGKPIKVAADLLTPALAAGPQTILVIGSDRRFSDRKDKHNARSDTIILLRMNADAKVTTIMSIPRDLEVELAPGGPPDKINAAYSRGGPALTTKVVKRVLSSPGRPFEINHIVNINFHGFKAVVDKLGCVYADIDRNYFNDNNPPAGGGEPYAVIAIKPGYQRLCGSRALDYVRFRHLDTDIVRAARQQDFLRQAKAQYGSSRIVGNRKALARIFGRYTQTDAELRRTTGLIKLLDLALFSAGRPVEEVHFPAILGDATDPFVTASSGQIRKAVTRFLGAQGPTTRPPRAAPRPPGRKRRQDHGVKPSAVPGLVDATSPGEQQATIAAAKVRFPVYYPRLITAPSRYMGPVEGIYPRAYRFRARGRVRSNYRLVLDAGGPPGEYYGVQGSTWKTPPLLADPSEVRRVNGHRLELFFDGQRLRVVAWRTPRAVYWVSNSLLETVPNRQLLGIAASLTRVGSRR